MRTRGTLPNVSFPSAGIGVSNTPYYVLALSRGPSNAFYYALNARCEKPDAFSSYQYQGEPSQTGPASSKTNSSKNSSGGCGMIQNNKDEDSSTTLFRVLNFSSLFILAFLGSAFLKRKESAFY